MGKGSWTRWRDKIHTDLFSCRSVRLHEGHDTHVWFQEFRCVSLTCFQQFVWSSCRCTLDDLANTIHQHMAGMHKDRPAACRSRSENHSIAMDSYSETLEDRCKKKKKCILYFRQSNSQDISIGTFLCWDQSVDRHRGTEMQIQWLHFHIRVVWLR